MRKQTHRQLAKKGDRNNKTEQAKEVHRSLCKQQSNAAEEHLYVWCQWKSLGVRLIQAFLDFWMRNAAEVGWDAKAEAVSRKNSSVHQNEGWEAIITAPHRTILTGEQKNSNCDMKCHTSMSLIWVDRLGKMYLGNVMQKASERIVQCSATSSDAQQTGLNDSQGSLGQSRTGLGDLRMKIKSSLFQDCWNWVSDCSKQVRGKKEKIKSINLKVSLQLQMLKGKARETGMRIATGRDCFIRIQSFKEYAGSDQIGDGRTTKSILWKSGKYFKRSRFSYMKGTCTG